MTSEQLPSYIGRYRVTGQLGAGGMGVVYLAIDERLDRRVAIKCLLKNPTSNSAHLRIRKEALLLAQLNHNNIVQIYDVVEKQNDVALVMEFVDGCSLELWQRERAPSLRQKIQLLKQICSGLARAHSMGIIHRDLKADNILIDDSGTAKISDFGIAKNWREDSDLTREQHVAGSWGAMSPEQALGKQLDNRCDLFALGVLAYKLLCGQSPFGDNDSAFVIMDRIVNSQHPPAAKLNPELPTALSQLLDRLLAKYPNKRPVNATAVGAELDAILRELEAQPLDTASRTVTITAENFHRQQRRRIRWGKWLAGGTVTIAVAALVGTIAAVLPVKDSGVDGKYIAIVAPSDSALTNRDIRLLRSNMLSAIKQGLSNRDGLWLIPYSESQQVTGQNLHEQARALNADLLLHPSLSCHAEHCEASLELIETGKFSVVANRTTTLELDESLESRARTLQQLNYLLPGYPPQDSESRLAISAEDYQTYLDLFEHQNDFANLGEMLTQLEALRDKTPDFPPYYELYGDMVIDQRFNTRSDATVDRLESFLRKAPPSIADHPAVLTAKLQLALSRNDEKRTHDLLEQLRVKAPDQAIYYFYASVYYQDRDDNERAIEAIDRALAQRDSYRYLLQKALILSLSGDMNGAKPILLRAMQMVDDNIDAISLLAGNELDQGRPAETIRLLNSARVKKLGPMDTYNLCLANYIEKQFDRALSCFSDVAARAPRDADPLLYQAEIANAQGQPEKAQAFAEKALALTRERKDWEGQLMQARAYAELGRAGRAIDMLLKIRRTAPDDLYVNYARAQVYITTGDLLSAKAHVRKTLEQGVSPIWFDTTPFAPVCAGDDFADLRADYPNLCAQKDKSGPIARK
ncbi:serine/threonine-protein kinase [Microbulbifer hainanensis]|uniref:serine/threonine-protein kinase n=1 Tax=Microbulbifer hainanensis TaxID=2735675 RepID=UPI001866BD01|nr:serine/threonine-protein kinase [Microbulbifer hainanensis]